MRQPDNCLCFGGSCWKRFCPNKQRTSTDDAKYERPKGKRKIRRPQILTLSASLPKRNDNNE